LTAHIHFYQFQEHAFDKHIAKAQLENGRYAFPTAFLEVERMQAFIEETSSSLIVF